MNSKTVLAYFLGLISCLILCLIIYLQYGEDIEVKDVLPSLVTGFVTFTALLFTYLNNRQQQKVQLQSTVHKEWVEKVRTLVAEAVVNTTIISKIKLMYPDIEGTEISKTLPYTDAANAFTEKIVLLSLYLDFKRNNEDIKFYNLLWKLHGEAANGQDVTMQSTIRDVQLQTQEIIDTRFKN